MEKHDKNADEIKKIYVHLQQLGLYNFFKSNQFDLFCEENGLEKNRDTIYQSLLQINNITIRVKQYRSSEEIIIDYRVFPEEIVKPFLKNFLVEIYAQKQNDFVEIIVSFLTYYSRYNQNLKDGKPTPIDNELMRNIGFDLIDLGYSEQDISIYYQIAGYDLYALISMNDPKSIKSHNKPSINSKENTDESYPIEIQESLKKFKTDFPDQKKVAFIMMQFGETKEHINILKSLRKTLAEIGLAGVRADDKTYHDDKYDNILTYLHGCGFGIAVFETITDQSFNPNVSLEAGYLMGLHKPICLLKEKSLKTLPSDLVGKLYKEFSIEQCDISINNVLRNWLSDKNISGN